MGISGLFGGAVRASRKMDFVDDRAKFRERKLIDASRLTSYSPKEGGG